MGPYSTIYVTIKERLMLPSLSKKLLKRMIFTLVFHFLTLEQHITFSICQSHGWSILYQSFARFMIGVNNTIFFSIFMAFWKDSMISPLSNIINHNHLTTEISQFLGSSNNPVLIRKLYEPHLFPSAPALKIFQKYFGNTEHRYKINHVQILNPGSLMETFLIAMFS